MQDTDHVAVLNGIRDKMVDARRQAAIDFVENDAVEAEYVQCQRHIDALDRAIADEIRLKPSGAGWVGTV